MQDERTVTPSEEDNVTTSAQEETEEVTEQASPSEEDNEVTPETIEELKRQIEERDKKIAEQGQKLRGSKEEALRLKQELESRLAEAKGQDARPQASSDDVEAIRALAKEAGIPLKEDIEELKMRQYQEKENEQLERFLKDYPIYNKPGDPKSDSAWEALREELTFYKKPEDPKKWYDVLKRAHKNLASNENVALEKGKALGMAQAKMAEQARIGGGASGNSSPQTKKSPDRQAVSEGFKSLRPNYY